MKKMKKMKKNEIMKIENAKNLLIAIKDQIAKNLPKESSLKFTEEFDNLIDSYYASKTYAKFCVKLLERVKLDVNPENKLVLLAVTNVINVFKNNGTREEFVKAAAAAYASYDVYDAHASAAAHAAYAAAHASAPSAALASAAAWHAFVDGYEYKQQSIDLLQVLKKAER